MVEAQGAARCAQEEAAEVVEAGDVWYNSDCHEHCRRANFYIVGKGPRQLFKVRLGVFVTDHK